MSDKPNRRAFLGLLGVGAAAGAVKAAGAPVDDKTAELDRQMAKLQLTYPPSGRSGLESVGLDWEKTIEDEKRRAKIDAMLADVEWGATRDPEEILKDLLMDDIDEKDAAKELQRTLASSWESISNYEVRDEAEMMADVMQGKVLRTDVSRIVSPKYITDPMDLATTRPAGWLKPDDSERMTKVVSLPFAMQPMNMYVRHSQEKSPQQHLADVLVDSHNAMLAELDNLVATAKREGKKVNMPAQKIQYVTHPTISIKRDAFMLEIFSYFHAVAVPAS